MIVVTLSKEQLEALLTGKVSFIVDADDYDDDYGRVGVCCDQPLPLEECDDSWGV